MKKYQINNFEENIYHEKLDNGLNVYIVPLKNKNNYSCMYVTKYGGRDIKFKVNGKEYNTPTGIAHFLEHKMFERKEDPFKFYGKFGTDVNASTSIDYTGYYFLGNKSFEKCLKYMLNWLKTINITEETVKKEQGIILEEASMYKDNPDRVLYNKIRENAFVKDQSRNKVIGSDEDIVSITLEDLKLCFNTFYSPNNMYLIITGNVDVERTINLIKEETKDQVVSSNKIEKLYDEEPDNVFKEYEEIKMNVETPKVSVAYKVSKKLFEGLNIDKMDLDIYLHSLFNIALGTTSKVREEWLLDNLFTSSFYRISEIDSHYLIEFYATSNKEDELIEKLEKYIIDLKIDEESFEREKKLWIAHEIKAVETPMSILYMILDDILDYDKVIPNKVEYIKNLSYENLKKVKDRLKYNNKVIIKIMPDVNLTQ